MDLQTRHISEVEPGIFATILPPCTAAVLPHVLLTEVPITWIVSHWPHDFGWWEAELPLKSGERPRRVRARHVEFDLEFPTAEFLRHLPEMADLGVVLHQMDRPVPDTLDHHRSSEPERYRVLRANGWRLTFDQHTRGDYASVVAPERGVLERILSQPAILAGELP